MPMIRIDGKAIAEKIISELKQRPRPEKRLAAVWVAPTSAAGFGGASSGSFLAQKEKTARELGVNFELIHLAEVVGQEELEEKIRDLAHDETVGGIIVQLPLPKRIDRDAVLKYIPAEKNVDEGLAVAVVKEILETIYGGSRTSINSFMGLKGKVVAVVGASGFLVGQPIVRWLDNLTKSHFVRLKTADVETENLQEFLKDADLVITGVGQADLIKPEWLKPGAGVIDFGYPADVDSQGLEIKDQGLSFYTPTPGGTGPILVAKLFENFYRLCAPTPSWRCPKGRSNG